MTTSPGNKKPDLCRASMHRCQSVNYVIGDPYVLMMLSLRVRALSAPRG